MKHLTAAWAKTAERFYFEVPWAESKDTMMRGEYEGGTSVVEIEANDLMEARLLALQLVYTRHQPSGGPHPVSDETLLQIIERDQAAGRVMASSRPRRSPRIHSWVPAAMHVDWRRDRSDPRFAEWANSGEWSAGDYCLDHGFAQVVERKKDGYVTRYFLHRNSGRGCDTCGRVLDPDDPKVQELKTYTENLDPMDFYR